jgi:hypothetical protein
MKIKFITDRKRHHVFSKLFQLKSSTNVLTLIEITWENFLHNFLHLRIQENTAT